MSPQEGFSTSLGVDPSIRITYHNIQKKAKNSSGGILASKSDVTAFTQRITIKNTRSVPISPLIIKDQIPVSVDHSFKVNLYEPAELGLPKDRREVDVGAGVVARWSFKAEDGLESDTSSMLKGSGVKSLREGVEEEGVVEWVCSLNAGKTTDLSLMYDVVAPAGQAWARNF